MGCNRGVFFNMVKKMNKKGLVPLTIIALILGVLFLFNVVGIATTFNKLSNSPWLIILLIFGIFILLRKK